MHDYKNRDYIAPKARPSPCHVPNMTGALGSTVVSSSITLKITTNIFLLNKDAMIAPKQPVNNMKEPSDQLGNHGCGDDAVTGSLVTLIDRFKVKKPAKPGYACLLVSMRKIWKRFGPPRRIRLHEKADDTLACFDN